MMIADSDRFARGDLRKNGRVQSKTKQHERKD